ncbi:hypothetical protein Hanom_Chr01g00055421 [Helianthus anomalus]
MEISRFGLEDLKFFCVRKMKSWMSWKNQFDDLIDKLKRYEIRMTKAEHILKFADALPTEWNEFLLKLKKDSRFSKLYPKEFINELKTHKYENDKTRKM